MVPRPVAREEEPVMSPMEVEGPRERASSSKRALAVVSY
jgi:hypothetical protein